ncbi:V-type ATPase assembly factor pkr1 like protein [Verticillium longisporum]
MASFAENLWNSVFTPGTTPTLLYATNASFAALQLTLLALLAATRSIHFIILSFLCAGLWRAINWFAAELAIAQAREAADNDKAAAGGAGPGGPADTPGGGSSSSDDDTEVDTAVDQAVRSRKTAGSASREVEVEGSAAGELKQRPAAATAGAASGPASVAGTQSSASTEDEWEKVSENENEKDK